MSTKYTYEVVVGYRALSDIHAQHFTRLSPEEAIALAKEEYRFIKDWDTLITVFERSEALIYSANPAA